MQRAVHGFAAASVLLLIAFSAWAWTRRVDVAACERYEQSLNSLLALDFRSIAEVMKARSGLVGHYDAIVQTEAARKRLRRTLRPIPPGLDARELEAKLSASEQARSESEHMIERFKREHAVLRNSLRYLPVLAGELDAVAPAGGSDGALFMSAAGLVRDELLLQSWQDESLLARIDRAIAQLAIAAGQQPSRIAIDGVLAHARIVRERTPVVQELIRALIARDEPGMTRAALAAFIRARQAAQRVADADASVRFVLALLALGSVATSIILGLRRSAASLRRTSAQLEQAVASLRVEQEKQKELAELKNRFVATASHEFRTPLSVIMSSSEMLDAYGERWSAEKKQEHFARIRLASLGMTRMLDAILMIGRRDAGLLKFEPVPLAIDRFCSEVVAAVGDASAQRARLVYRGLTRDDEFRVDPTLLRHMLENLLSNALKYSPNGSPVELELQRENGELRFDVRDRGIGISPEDQKHLFETFHRGKNVGAISGTGLGLSVVRGAVELHGGRLLVASELNVGTQFTIRIPC